METPERPHRITLADDHPLFRKGLRELIETDPRCSVIAEAGSGTDAIEQIVTLKPDLAVLDIDMPGKDGLDVVRETSRQALATRYLILTMHNAHDLFMEAIDIGVNGFVLKESAVTDISIAVQTVLRGGDYVSPSLSLHRMLRAKSERAAVSDPSQFSALSPTQMRILQMIARQMTSKEIADDLGISYRTVENHRGGIVMKLGLGGSNSLLKFALEHKAALLSWKVSDR